jgi:predicted peptidase
MCRNLSFINHLLKYFLPALLIFICCKEGLAQETSWQPEIKKIEYISTADSTNQPALIYVPNVKNQRLPLLVALHTWSGNYKQKEGSKYSEWCIKNHWYMIHPNFRGPNQTPKAMGSEYVIKDIVSAVEYMKKHYSIDENRIYLVGYSGGGYASLLMAGVHPEIWAAVSAWDGISDLQEWWKYSKEYRAQIEAAAGGNPHNEEVEYIKRSPITYLSNSKSVKLDINSGINDKTVPFEQSLLAFNKIVNDKFKITPKQISELQKMKQEPEKIKVKISDKNYGSKYPLFRKVAGNTRITIFEGGHEIVYKAALKWLAEQQKNSSPVWLIK